MSHGVCNRCGYPIAEPAPDYVRCGNAHPRIADLWDDQMAEAVQRQMQRAQASAFIDRRDWTDDQWIDDAERLMNEPDGAITSLVNGHVMALLRRVRHKGWRRADVSADSYEDALEKLLADRRNVFYARVYPAAIAYSVNVEWLTPTVQVRHAPHDDEVEIGESS